MEYCFTEKRHLIIGTDANSHHTIWGSTDINERGEILLEALVRNSMTIINIGNEPTFVTRIRKEVLDLTLATGFIGDRIEGWRVSDEQMLSDHRMIVFELKVPDRVQLTYRNPRATNWDVYLDLLAKGLNFMSFDMIESVDRLDE